MRMTVHHLKIGTKVKGKYSNVPYSGIIEHREALGNYGTAYYVKLDQPITTKWTKYDKSICLNQNVSDEREFMQWFLEENNIEAV